MCARPGPLHSRRAGGAGTPGWGVRGLRPHRQWTVETVWRAWPTGSGRCGPPAPTLAQWTVVHFHCMKCGELHGCCVGMSLAEALLRQHIDGVARASSALRRHQVQERVERALPRPALLTILAPVSTREPHGGNTVGGSAIQLPRRRSELGNRRRRCHGQPPSGWHLHRRYIFQLPAARCSWSVNKACSATP